MVYARQPLPIDDQVAAMRRYLRHLRSALSREYASFFERTEKRKDCPFEIKLRSMRLDETRNAVALAEACITELRRQRALSWADFKPGDQILVTYNIKGHVIEPHRYLVIDVEPANRGDVFRFVVMEVTKHGKIHKGRCPRSLYPDRRQTVQPCREPLTPDGEHEAAAWKEAGERSIGRVLDQGDLTLFKPVKNVWGQSVGYRAQY